MLSDILIIIVYNVHVHVEVSSWSFPVASFTSNSYPTLYNLRFHDNSSTDISSTTLRLQTFRLQTFRLQTFRLLLYTSVEDSYTSNFCFRKPLFSSIPTSTYTMIPFYQSHFH